MWVENNKIKQNQTLAVSKIKSLNFETLEDEVEKTKILVTEDSLLIEGWSLAETGRSNILIKLNQVSLKLGNYVEGKIFYGVKTGYNEAFFINESTYDLLIKADPKNIEIIKPLIVGDDIRKYEINYQKTYLIFVRRGTNIEKYPTVKKYLEKFRQRLEPRPKDFFGDWNGRKVGSYQWYEIQDSVDYWESFEQSKIVYPDIAKESRFSLDRTGSYPVNTIYLIPNEDKYLLALLNSKLIFFFMSQNSAVLGDSDKQGRLRFFGQYMEQVPIRKINFTTNSDRRQQGLENLINLYQQYQTDHQLDPILSQCEQHLNQQPEEADIIHDFLAHLAEQMIQLNQQKQSEIKGFLKWLERFIGCPVDTLKNKSKIQNYLGDYTKQQTLDPALDFDGLITILNQNKKLIKIDPNSRKDQEPIENEYQTSLNTLLPIKTQLKNCDNLIDEIVYQLYGLTPEEKAIIEDSVSKS